MAAAVASSSQSFRPLSPYQSPSLPYTTQPPPQVQQQRSANGGARISPAVLFIVVILAAIFFVSGLLHLLVRLLLKKQHGRGGGPNASPRQGSGRREAAEDRQLQQLFHLHDSGLDQPLIDALPVFAYRDIVGGGDKEPFDCAVCLCEFDGEDRLRLLPACGHAFHLRCIDTWLLSNSTCPLCRGALFVPGMTMEESLVFDFDERLEEEVPSPEELPRDEAQPVAEKRVFPVRLGKFKNAAGNQGVGNGDAAGTVCRREAGESSSTSSSGSLDARRCFSMGTYQYVLGASELRVVALQQDPSRNGVGSRSRRRRAAGASSDASAETMEGKRICARNKGESFSVSKIWQWRAVKGKLPAGSENCSDTGSLPWMRRDAIGDKSNV